MKTNKSKNKVTRQPVVKPTVSINDLPTVTEQTEEVKGGAKGSSAVVSLGKLGRVE